ncbi:MAG TPA: aspartate aminotransferase family protein [Bryobacterales bacterium]|nr:aspartate aminotransferase family protein [Bryobacterales bacterium]
MQAIARKKVPLSESQILRAYTEKTPTSARLYARAERVFPSGVTHIARYLEPHPLFVSRAAGSRKWDVDGNEYTDYFGGHGALILGHNHPAVVEAVTAQLARGTHYGASHELEIEWAELIQQMVPCAERVRFTSSGTEATMMALRLARAFTGKPMLVRFAGHFHGWHDHVAASSPTSQPGEPQQAAPGILQEIADRTLVCPPNDIDFVRRLCESRQDIAALILEPTGATFGHAPLVPGFLAAMREITARHGIVLIFDEVVTGFRCSTGGAQLHYHVTPDLATVAKIVAGGYPGAAVVGRAEILGALEHHHSGAGLLLPAIPHQGTFNGNPISAAAGVATLRLLRSTDIIERANRAAAAIRDQINGLLRRQGVNWCAYGEFSAFHIFCNSDPEPVSPEAIHAGRVHWSKLKGATAPELLEKIRLGFLTSGVDAVGWPGGIVSGVHNAQDIDRTVSAFEKLLAVLAEEGDLG